MKHLIIIGAAIAVLLWSGPTLARDESMMLAVLVLAFGYLALFRPWRRK